MFTDASRTILSDLFYIAKWWEEGIMHNTFGMILFKPHYLLVLYYILYGYYTK